MPHLDDDVLTLLALGEVLADPETTAHLDSCDRCRSELLTRITVRRRTCHVRSAPCAA